jgi:hypothetical protein
MFVKSIDHFGMSSWNLGLATIIAIKKLVKLSKC